MPRFRRLDHDVLQGMDEPACDSCPLADCMPGLWATVSCLECAAHDAQRLRTLGLFEGTRIQVIHTRSGMLLDVRGSRLALGRGLAAMIRVRPVAA